MPTTQFLRDGTGLLVRPLPTAWHLHRGKGRARCCAVVGFFSRGQLVLASYIVLN